LTLGRDACRRNCTQDLGALHNKVNLFFCIATRAAMQNNPVSMVNGILRADISTACKEA
jgi:hypothetical protein